MSRNDALKSVCFFGTAAGRQLSQLNVEAAAGPCSAESRDSTMQLDCIAIHSGGMSSREQPALAPSCLSLCESLPAAIFLRVRNNGGNAQKRK
jgi:hypothetical protein